MLSLATNALHHILVFRIATHPCALPLMQVLEVMRPLPVRPLAGAPEGVLGVAIVRGKPIPVLDLATVLGEGSVASGASSRFVVLQTGERRVALLVESVSTILSLEAMEFEALPSLWQGSRSPIVAALGVLDDELLMVLESARLLPSDLIFENMEGDPCE